MNELTEIQRRVFEFVRDKLASGDPAPTPREIAAKFGWAVSSAREDTTSKPDSSFAKSRIGLQSSRPY